ncbi:DUF3718 domain-containing protein [Colwelliaceae bacterium BS250]
MKLIPIQLIVILLSVISFQSTAQDNIRYQFQGIDNSLNTRICVAAGNNNISALKVLSRLDQNGMRDIAENLTCNDKDITNFAAQNGALKTTKYLSLHAPKKYKVNVENVEIQDLAHYPNHKIKVIYVASK